MYVYNFFLKPIESDAFISAIKTLIDYKIVIVQFSRNKQLRPQLKKLVINMIYINRIIGFHFDKIQVNLVIQDSSKNRNLFILPQRIETADIKRFPGRSADNRQIIGGIGKRYATNADAVRVGSSITMCR